MTKKFLFQAISLMLKMPNVYFFIDHPISEIQLVYDRRTDGWTDRRTNRWMDRLTDGPTLLYRCENASKKLGGMVNLFSAIKRGQKTFVSNFYPLNHHTNYISSEYVFKSTTSPYFQQPHFRKTCIIALEQQSALLKLRFHMKRAKKFTRRSF